MPNISDDVIDLDAPSNQALLSSNSSQKRGDIILNADGSKTLILNYPFTAKLQSGGKIEEKHYTSLTFRRPTGGDMRVIEKIKDGMQSAITTFTRLSGEVEAIFDRLDIDDLNLITEIMEGFLSRSPKTGTKSLPQSE